MGELRKELGRSGPMGTHHHSGTGASAVPSALRTHVQVCLLRVILGLGPM